MNNSSLFLIDASIPFFRYYFSLPDHWISPCGQVAGGLYGFTHWLKRFIKQVQPRRIAACFDESLGSCYRNGLHPGYKASRPLPDNNITWQLNNCKAICKAFGIPVYASKVYEADDLIATLAAKHRASGGHCTVISRDKDLIQVIHPGDCFWNFPDDAALDYSACTEKMGVKPEQVPDLLALTGDPIDDIPGIPGIGKKTAQALLTYFANVQTLLEQYPTIATLPIRGARGIAQKISDHQTQITIAHQLATAHTQAKLGRAFKIDKAPTQIKKLQGIAEQSGFSLKAITLD